MRLEPVPLPHPPTEDGLIPTALAIAGAVQWVASCSGAWLVSAMTRSTVSVGSGGMREGALPSRLRRQALADPASDVPE
jgi:hypothetical protein